MVIQLADGPTRLADPMRDPGAVPAGLTSPALEIADGLRLLAMRAAVQFPDGQDVATRPQTTALARLHDRGFSETVTERFFRPFSPPRAPLRNGCWGPSTSASRRTVGPPRCGGGRRSRQSVRRTSCSTARAPGR